MVADRVATTANSEADDASQGSGELSDVSSEDGSQAADIEPEDLQRDVDAKSKKKKKKVLRSVDDPCACIVGTCACSPNFSGIHPGNHGQSP